MEEFAGFAERVLGWEWERESERFSGLEGGTVNEQHHDLRRACDSRRDDDPGFRRVEPLILGGTDDDAAGIE